MMASSKIATGVFSIIAVLLGVVSKLNPEVFLHVPEVGFKLYNLAGGNNGRLPPYEDSMPFHGNNTDEWLRDGDVVVASGFKTGTTMLLYCLDAVRRKGSDDVGLPFTDVMYTTPWMELAQMPGESWSTRKEKYETTMLPDGTYLRDYWDNSKFPYRIFKSHYTPNNTGKAGFLPVLERPGVKYLFVSRNPIEVAKSLYAYFPKHAPDFRKMWGGFPRLWPNVESLLMALLPGGELYEVYFNYVKAWWPFAKRDNVLTLHYSDMIRDLDGLVEKLAQFVSVSLDPAEKEKVMEKCSFGHMKKNNHLFDMRLPFSTRASSFMKPSTFVNKGESGGAHKDIDPEVLKVFMAAVDREFENLAMKKWAMEGGDIESC